MLRFQSLRSFPCAVTRLESERKVLGLQVVLERDHFHSGRERACVCIPRMSACMIVYVLYAMVCVFVCLSTLPPMLPSPGLAERAPRRGRARVDLVADLKIPVSVCTCLHEWCMEMWVCARERVSEHTSVTFAFAPRDIVCRSLAGAR